MNALPPSHWKSLRQADIDWLLSHGITMNSLISPVPILEAVGSVAHDGRFDETAEGTRWLVFEEADDFVFWCPTNGKLATDIGRAFALGGDEAIGNPGTFSFGGWLNIFADPLDWLRNRRDGIVVLDWTRAFDELRDVPRVAVCSTLIATYEKHMRPARLPSVSVLDLIKEERAA